MCISGLQLTSFLAQGLDFAYPEATKIGGLVSGPPQQGAGTRESPSGWLIAAETWQRPKGSSESAEGQVQRQMIWGGCVGLVLWGRIRMEPLIAQACFWHLLFL
jgi:small ligand-binding sensory domain FIST